MSNFDLILFNVDKQQKKFLYKVEVILYVLRTLKAFESNSCNTNFRAFVIFVIKYWVSIKKRQQISVI